jgi:hypothetical protein
MISYLEVYLGKVQKPVRLIKLPLSVKIGNGTMAPRKQEAAQRDIGAFALETATDQEIHVRHRASGHVLRFVRSEGGAIADLHRIDLDFSSSFDGETLVSSARQAAQEYLKSASFSND